VLCPKKTQENLIAGLFFTLCLYCWTWNREAAYTNQF